ncbi:homocysteine S-methyltransferase family protein [Anaerostipes hadrus]|uniref:Homocysteine S-methyltransferase family protein n=1 Tax=Anaerostipes hadrus TaxID=649756 RepID=A0AAQ3JHZ2_ANAHA|nr:homocysteine S-methyltransferase family protein [Anaerostipes hadrus]WMD16392.1 homocysteine S-methyltransferase family protein [Anaerostipes hadrus]WMD25199.1 homocysteine S-methyltransferase family protein [Anaerostipes hadrus]
MKTSSKKIRSWSLMALCPHHWKIGGVSLNSKLWTAKILAEQPELIKQVHKNYFKAGADIILFETVPSLKEAKVEAEIAEEYGYDYWISFSCLSENIICEGTPIAECATTFAKGYPHLKMIGVNCTKPEYITGLIHKIKENCDIPIGVYPNSGEEYDAVKKVWFGKQSALSFEQYAYNYMKSGASAVGGCCTTVAKHVEEVVRAKKRFSEEQK